jgi:toxin FitB
MIILDTNVISEIMRPQPSEQVINWLDAQNVNDLCTTSITWSELLHGIEELPDGRRKQGLQETLQAVRERMIEGRILPFDEMAAQRFARLITSAQRNGQTIHIADGQIAAIALHHTMSVASRDTQPFLAAGVKLINPWTSTQS